jgi:hypothetical protein
MLAFKVTEALLKQTMEVGVLLHIDMYCWE